MDGTDYEILSHVDSFDQVGEVARLRKWATRVSTRERRHALCWGLIELIERDKIQYGECLSTSGMRRAFAITGTSAGLEYIIERVYPDMAAAGLLMALMKRVAVVQPGYSSGRPDLIFVPLAPPVKPILEDDGVPHLSKTEACQQENCSKLSAPEAGGRPGCRRRV